jgi:hypothetical protein
MCNLLMPLGVRVFFFQICEVSGLAIIHKMTYPYLARGYGRSKNIEDSSYSLASSVMVQGHIQHIFVKQLIKCEDFRF